MDGDQQVSGVLSGPSQHQRCFAHGRHDRPEAAKAMDMGYIFLGGVVSAFSLQWIAGIVPPLPEKETPMRVRPPNRTTARPAPAIPRQRAPGRGPLKDDNAHG